MAIKSNVIHGQLISTNSAVLLVPNTAVAEIVHYVEPQASDGAPQWLLGSIEWRGLRIPLVSFERAVGDDAPSPGAENRVAVLNGVSSGDALRFFAVVIHGNPRLVNVARDSIQQTGEGDRSRLSLQRVTVNDVAASIPDLESLEALIRSAGVRSERMH